MKVAKVVINSVSHDARVLKEAEAVHGAGFHVVIVGIQDANSSAPIQFLENGVAIRRAGWQASAFRPSPLPYLWQFGLAVACITAGAAILLWALENYGRVLPYFTPANFLYGISAASLTYFAARIWGDFSKRQKHFTNLKKREADEMLKYEHEFSTYRRAIGGAMAEVAPIRLSTGSSDESMERPRRGGVMSRLPRPFMAGPLSALSPANLKRWKVVFARERRILDILREEQPDIVHAHDLSALPVAASYARRSGAKLVFDAHEIYDHLAQSEDELSALNGRILNKYAPDVDMFITINESIARYYHKSYPALPRAVVIKNATKRAGAFEYDGRLHAAAGLDRGTRILIYQGGFAPKRGLIPLLLSAEYLNPEWSIVFMGWGKLEEELRRVADSLKMKNPALESRIRFVPKVKQSELPYWTAGASLGAIPYENTGLNHWYCNPNKLWEYPNAGVPIIASPFPELRKVIHENGIGFLFPDPLSAREIATAINRISDEELRDAASSCRAFIERDNWDVYASRLQSAYAGLK